jgi:hypothetical protein
MSRATTSGGSWLPLADRADRVLADVRFPRSSRYDPA